MLIKSLAEAAAAVSVINLHTVFEALYCIPQRYQALPSLIKQSAMPCILTAQ